MNRPHTKLLSILVGILVCLWMLQAGAMAAGETHAAGWYTDNAGRYFYTDSQGNQIYGWLQLDGKKYYINETIGCVTGSFYTDGAYYYFRDDGSLWENLQKPGWIHTKKGWQYILEDGSLAKGWLKENGINYYLHETTGIMVTGWQKVNNVWCHFKADGSYDPSQPLNGWIKDEKGWHYFGNNQKEAFGWIYDDGHTYYVDEKQGLLTGNDWYLEEEDRWYRFQASGAMVPLPSGWVHVGRGWIYRKADGSHTTGWLNLGGKTYYLDPYMGIMATGAVTIDGKKYKFDDQGALLPITRKGWVVYGDSWRYYTDANLFHVGWKTVDGKKYYFAPITGKMAKGTVKIDGICYLLHPKDGHAMTGWQKDEYNHWYYLQEDSRIRLGWIQDGNKSYYIDFYQGMLTDVQTLPDGKTYIFCSSGERAAGWCKSANGKYYYAAQDGRVQSGWLQDGGQTYYLTQTGAMAEGWTYIDEKWYYFAPHAGHMLTQTIVDGYKLGGDGVWIP